MKMIQISFLVALSFACIASAQLSQKRPDPVPILKQISKQNDDGSYSFGYEGGDGTYKIETKLANGEVQGKYGYLDDEGNLREVEYGATSKQGFRPQGNGINIPPPSAGNEVALSPLAEGEEDDGQYREDPRIYDTKAYKQNRPVQKASRRPVFQSLFEEPARPAYRQPQQAVQQPITYKQPENSFSFRQSIPSSTFQYQQPSQNLDYEEPVQYSGIQRPSGFPSFSQPAGARFSDYQQPQYQTVTQQPQYQTVTQQPQYQTAVQQPQYQTYSQQPQYQTYTQPQYQSYSQPQYQSYSQQQQPQLQNYNFHPSVKNFDVGSGSYSISYSGR